MNKLTRSQQNAMYKYERLLADALNEAGYWVKDVLMGGQVQPFIDMYYGALEIINDGKYQAIDWSVMEYNLPEIIKHIDIKRLNVKMPWSQELVHEIMWIPVLEAMTKGEKDSSTEMDRLEPGQVHSTLSEYILELTDGNIYVPFPSEETMYTGE